MAKTSTWEIPYPDMLDPADVQGEEGIDKLAGRVDALFTLLQAMGSIPGEVKLWPGSTPPDRASYGHWVWCDGLDYDAGAYPKAAANIDPGWKTAFGKPNPGATRFRVPDLRGVSPSGMDAMPGGARANRTLRAAAALQAASTGEEFHTLAAAEMPAHGHGLSDPGHAHPIADGGHAHPPWPPGWAWRMGHYVDGPYGDGAPGPGPMDAAQQSTTTAVAGTGIGIYAAGTGISIAAAGGGGAHENLPPTVFVPYICKLDD